MRIIAQTGWTTKKLNDAIEAAGLEDTFNLVSLLIGVNNQFQGRTIIEYQSDFEALARKAIKLAGGKKERVFIISIPDYGFTPFGTDKQYLITPQIDVFNQVNKEISDSLGLTYFDITDISREGLGEPTLLASDGLHPSAIMYKKWVDLMVGEVVKKVLSTKY
jgi:lysophospholipase L1-like esterase